MWGKRTLRKGVKIDRKKGRGKEEWYKIYEIDRVRVFYLNEENSELQSENKVRNWANV